MTQNNITTFSFTFEYRYIPYFIIALVGITSNALLLIALIKDPLKCFRNSGTYLIMNLSVTDLLMCIFEIPFHLNAIVITGWDRVFRFLTLTSGTVSLVSIASISIDRFLLVAYPLKHRHLFTGKVMPLWLLGVWLSGVAFPMTGLFFDRMINNVLALHCFTVSIILLSVFMYAMTFLTLKRHWKDIGEQNSTESCARKTRILKERKFLKTIVLIACIAFFCIVPSTIYFQLYDSLHYSKDNLAVLITTDILHLIFYINFAVNPLVYLLRLPNYRKTFYLIYCKRRS